MNISIASVLLLLASAPSFAAVDREAGQVRVSRPYPVVVIEGRLELLIEDRFTEHTATSYLSLKTTDGDTYRLRSAEAFSDVVRPGEHVRLTLRPHDGSFEVLHAEALPEKERRAEATQTVSGNRKVLIIPYKFNDVGSYPFSTTQLRAAIDDAALLLSRTSYGITTTVSLSGSTSADLNSTVIGSYPTPHTAGECNLGLIMGDAESLAHDFTPHLYDHRIVVTTRAGCEFEGLTTPSGTSIWINGNLNGEAYAHEIAHNLGLLHSKQCLPPVTGIFCTFTLLPEFGDPDDLMSTAHLHLNASNKGYLGWYLPGHVVTVSTSRVVTLGPLEDPASAVNAVQILPTAGGPYWVEFRQAILGDEVITSNPTTGALIHLAGGATSYLFNAGHATDSTFNHRALVPPSIADAPSVGMKISALEKGGSGSSAWLRIRIDLTGTGGSTPKALDAHQSSSSQISLSWAAPDLGADGYEVSRAPFAGGSVPGAPSYQTIATNVVTTSLTDSTGGATPLQSGYTYLYRVRACKPCGSTPTWSPLGDPDPATLYGDFSLTGAPVRAVHLLELRTAVDVARSLVGLSVGGWAEVIGAGTPVRGTHLDELRTRADAPFGPPTGGYTDASPAAGKVIRSVHVAELRNRLR